MNSAKIFAIDNGRVLTVVSLGDQFYSVTTHSDGKILHSGHSPILRSSDDYADVSYATELFKVDTVSDIESLQFAGAIFSVSTYQAFHNSLNDRGVSTVLTFDSALHGLLEVVFDWNLFKIGVIAGATDVGPPSSGILDFPSMYSADQRREIVDFIDLLGSASTEKVSWIASHADVAFFRADSFYNNADLTGTYYGLDTRAHTTDFVSGGGEAFGVAIDDTPTNGFSPWVDSLVGATAWDDLTDDGTVTVTYTFASGNGGEVSGLVWESYEIAAFNLAISQYEAVANLDFVYVPNLSTADITWWLGSNTDMEGVLGWHYLPGGDTASGAFNVEGYGWSPSGLGQGGYGYVTVIHELGHGLGLEHPHDGFPLFPGVGQPFDDYGDHSLNQGIWTTMSYNSGWPERFPSHSAENYGYEGSPMSLDIAAIQTIYGANTTYASGDNTYTLPSTNTLGTYWFCIWDTGGTDLITNAGSTLACMINLTAASLVGLNAGGHISSASGVVGGYTIASGVVIENATGGSGNDTITGNSVSNLLNGEGGNDLLTGGKGNDSLVGGQGTDTAVFTGNFNSYTIAYNSATQIFTVTDNTADRDGVDTVSGVENFQFADGTRTALSVLGNSITGNSRNNVLTGTSGVDIINGLAGNDRLTGGAGADVMDGGDGSDLYILALATDYATGELIADTGSTGTDEIRLTTTTASTLTLANTVSGIENIVIGTGTGASATTTGTTAINVNAQALTGAVSLTGNAGANQLTGGSGNDTLTGNGGNDTLTGNSGNDTLTGGVGADTMDGGEGSDLYILALATNYATGELITDTGSTGTDEIRLTTTTASTLTLANTVSGIENIVIGTGTAASATTTGTTAINVNAQALTGAVSLTGNAGANQLTGGSGNDTLTGNSGNDTLTGNGGNDRLIGGAGRDTLLGGTGNDTFVYLLITESGITSTTRDTISDFALGDLIDLSAIDAKSGGTANDAFTWLGSTAPTAANANGALWFSNGVLNASNDTDVAAEFSIALTGITSMSVTDFVL